VLVLLEDYVMAIDMTVGRGNFLSEAEAMAVRALEPELQFEDMKIIYNKQTIRQDSIRRCKGRWVLNSFLIPEIDQKIKEHMLDLVENKFKVDHSNKWIFQVARYDVGDFVEWHADDQEWRQGLEFRKFVTMIQLSHFHEYEGGDVEIGSGYGIGSRDIGAAFFCNSMTSHRITPVTKGTRYSLTTWLTGPPWR
jgi:PKHD-type hydroxylase